MLQDGLYHHIDAANVRGVEKPDNKQKSLSMQCERKAPSTRIRIRRLI